VAKGVVVGPAKGAGVPLTPRRQIVTPAKAGVHSDCALQIKSNMDSSLRWNDGIDAIGN